MGWYWSERSIPELAGVAEELKTPILERCRKNRPFCWERWVALLAPLIAIWVADRLTLTADIVSRQFVRLLELSSPLLAYFAFLIADVASLRRHIQTELPHHCRACGYDLTGNETGVCPECGLRQTGVIRTDRYFSLEAMLVTFLIALAASAGLALVAGIIYLIWRTLRGG